MRHLDALTHRSPGVVVTALVVALVVGVLLGMQLQPALQTGGAQNWLRKRFNGPHSKPEAQETADTTAAARQSVSQGPPAEGLEV